MVSIKNLRTFEIFKHLSDAELKLISPFTKKEEFEAGMRIIEENSVASKLFLVLEGRVSITMKGDFGKREMVIDDAVPGEIFGWSALAEPHISTAAVFATEPSIFLTIDSAALRQFLEQNKDIGYKVMKEMTSVISSRFRKVIGQFVGYI
jgi:CRP-like cAMP-binding protein